MNNQRLFECDLHGRQITNRKKTALNETNSVSVNKNRSLSSKENKQIDQRCDGPQPRSEQSKKGDERRQGSLSPTGIRRVHMGLLLTVVLIRIESEVVVVVAVAAAVVPTVATDRKSVV